jgi:imidazolonepropionase-like amidohydrolase
MAARGIAWTPTLTALLEPLPTDGSREGRERRERLLENDRAMLAEAVTSGVRILAGTDCAGTLSDEVRHLVAFGLTPVHALRAATTDARAFLGMPSLADGAPADVVTFDGDPRDDPDVLADPAAVVLNGVRVR